MSEDTMLVAIDSSYIAWIKENSEGDLSSKETADYINDVLAEHKASWDELKE